MSGLPIPDEAYEAANRAAADAFHRYMTVECGGSVQDYARAGLEAAAPHLMPLPEPTDVRTDDETGTTYASFPGNVFAMDAELDGATDDAPVWMDCDTYMTASCAWEVGLSLLAASAWRERNAGGGS